MDIGQRIKGLRASRSMTQTALAAELSLPQNYISEIENSGPKSFGMSVRQMLRFANGLRVTPMALITQTEYLRVQADIAALSADEANRDVQ